MIRYAFHILLIGFSLGLTAQEGPAYLELRSDEDELKSLFEQLYDQSGTTDPDSLLLKIRDLMAETLQKPGAMDYPWTRLDRIGVIESEDGLLRVFTWHYEDNPDAFRYFGFIQVRKRRGDPGVFWFQDMKLPQRGVYLSDQRVEQWYGKLYYGIVTRKYRRKVFYTLMGLDFNNSRSNIKSVEVLSLQRNRPRFEKGLFSKGDQKVDRVVLEYSDQVSSILRYDPILEMIVYDHLVPMHPVYEKNFEFYGPDGSYDGLEFSDGQWIFREDIDARLYN